MQSVARNLTQTYEATASSVAEARTRLAQFAAEAGAAPEQIDGVRLAASEAMTNAILHAYRGEPGTIRVQAAVASDELWILISDDGCGLTPRAERPGMGLGLGLISQVSDDLTLISRAEGGTEVRMRFDLDGGRDRPPAPPDSEPEQRRPARGSRRSGPSPSMSLA